MEAKFLSRSSIYKGDYDCLFRTPQNEMKTELHYHDFFEIVLYLGNAGIFTINGQEYLMKRGDIVLINMFDPHTLKYNKNTYYERFSISIDPNLLLSFNTENSNLLDIFTTSNQHFIWKNGNFIFLCCYHSQLEWYFWERPLSVFVRRAWSLIFW